MTHFQRSPVPHPMSPSTQACTVAIRLWPSVTELCRNQNKIHSPNSTGAHLNRPLPSSIQGPTPTPSPPPLLQCSPHAACCCNVVVLDHHHIKQPHTVVLTPTYQHGPLVQHSQAWDCLPCLQNPGGQECRAMLIQRRVLEYTGGIELQDRYRVPASTPSYCSSPATVMVRRSHGPYL